MNRRATVLFIAATFVVGLAAQAQPVRNGVDVIFARDVAGAAITLDGMPNEAVWQQAEIVDFAWNAPPGGLPGSGQKVEGNPTLADPPDPIDTKMHVLRDGNVLWLAFIAQDASIGGGTGLWNFDGVIMSILDRSQRPDTFSTRTDNNYFANGTVNSEWILSWWSPADTTDGSQTYSDGSAIPSGVTVPGDPIRGFGDYGVGFGQGRDGDARSDEDKLIWDFMAMPMGTSVTNDDTHGPDTGYYIEMFVDLGALGYDFTQADGDKVPLNIAIQDSDYNWPANPDSSFLARVWFQNQWANNFNEGVGFIYGMPGVDVNSGALPQLTEPEAEIYSAGSLGAPTVDGVLDEDVWTQSDTLFYIQYEQEPEGLDRNPSFIGYHNTWFRPDVNGDGNAAIVVDPSLGMFKMFIDGSTLYIGLDAADQAVSGHAEENGRDGFRIIIRDRDSVRTQLSLFDRTFDFAIDSTGAIRYDRDAASAQIDAPGAVVGAVGLKGASTVADPSDVDEGYQIEVAIDLAQVAGYPSDLGDGMLWIAINFFDGDFLQAPTDSYAMRTWFLGERTNGASFPVYMNADIGVAVDEDIVDLPAGIELKGNYPNPFAAKTTLSYTLPQSGDVKVAVFNVLGQKVAEIDAGSQSAGNNRVEFSAAGLGAGLYLYRIELARGSDGEVRHTAVGNMMLTK